ncbi:MAG: lysine--tRNA ligase [Chloroflexi bacterium RBG_19FT_COMBO_62_14]|nr:MAG: lysine--tRNA ligase [Chloroflexi bacterium RBG_19FT_COMBO_62_14]
MADLNELEQIRLEKLARLKASGKEAYPGRVRRTHTTAEAIQAFERAGDGPQTEIEVVGRLRSIRRMGKVTFAHIEDGGGRLQLYLRADDLGQPEFTLFNDVFDLGDFVQARGTMFRTKTGEVTLHVGAVGMLAKAVSPLPAAKDEVVDGQRVVHAAFSDPEARYRERYADLAVNPEVRRIFQTRAGVIRALRAFLDARGFVEVETPILQQIYGGAAARPFVTHHNQLHQDLYLRISFELYLKRLLVGGIERVYEIGRDFRNEGVSFKHNPEFTQLEFYMAFADYRAVMELTEQMLAYVAEQAVGSTTILYRGHTIDLSPPWKRQDLRSALLEASGIDISTHPTADSLRRAMITRGHQPSERSTRGKLIESLLASQVEPNLIQPTFIYDYPRDISPLAKSIPDDAGTVERFEGFAGGMELCNAFTELNDPLDQEQRFLEMGRDYAADDEERHPMDEDYLRAMRYGMPPNGGFGMGVDRLTMLLTDQSTIREVILFPHLRAKGAEAPEDQA